MNLPIGILSHVSILVISCEFLEGIRENFDKFYF